MAGSVLGWSAKDSADPMSMVLHGLGSLCVVDLRLGSRVVRSRHALQVRSAFYGVDGRQIAIIAKSNGEFSIMSASN